jgi:hypothetical protein
MSLKCFISIKLHVFANGAGGGGGGLGIEGGGGMGGMGGCMGGMGGGWGEGSGSGPDMHHLAQRSMFGYAFSLAPMGRLTEVPSWNLSGKLRHVRCIGKVTTLYAHASRVLWIASVSSVVLSHLAPK